MTGAAVTGAVVTGDGRGGVVRVELPGHLRILAGIGNACEVELDLGSRPPTLGGLFDALEERHPRLRGTIRDRDTGERRAYMRYFAERVDLSHEPPDAPLPPAVASGEAVLRVVGAIAGG